MTNSSFRLNLIVDPSPLRRTYLDLCYIYSLINNNIDCAERLGVIYFNLPYFNSRNNVSFLLGTYNLNYSRFGHLIELL